MSKANFERCKAALENAFSRVDSAVYSRPVAVRGVGNTTTFYQAGIARHSGQNAFAGRGA